MSLFDDDEWGHTIEQSGDFARVEQLAGHLLIVFPLGYIEHHPTRFTQPGKKSDVIVCDLIDLDAADEQTGIRGKIYRNAWWRQSQLIIMLRPMIGKKVLGRIAKGVSRNGLNPPWVLNDAVAEPGTVDLAKQWAAANPNFVLSPFQAPAPPPPQAAPAPQQPQYQPPGQYPPQPAQAPYFGQPATNQYNVPPQPNQFLQQPANTFNPAQVQTFPAPPPPPAYAPPPARDPYAEAAAAQAQQYQQAQQQVPSLPAYPVAGSAPMDQNMLDMMRAERMRREEAYNQQQAQPTNPPF